MIPEKSYDIIVIGAGHAGCEAALAPARMGFKTALFTINIDHIAQLSCNPSIGGLAKGQLVREIDALGGEMALAADNASIQFKVLNINKGPAVRGLRSQADKYEYPAYMRRTLQNTKNLDVKQASVRAVTTDDKGITGIITDTSTFYSAKSVIITAGTFLNGIMYIGLQQFKGGRLGDPPSEGLSESLIQLGFRLGRMKTGTNPRIDIRSVDLDKFTPQPGDAVPVPFSFKTEKIEIQQVMCWLARTNKNTADIIMKNLDRSPLYSSSDRMIFGIGPRYCPSIEDKIVKFPEKTSHQVFLEPEAKNSNEIYLNGLSTSLPRDVQLNYVRSIEGMEKAEITRPGYGIEYDYAPPTQLNKYLETKLIPGLFFAGQINGTSGYEEAAAQGLIAGINAGLKLSGKSMFSPGREESYLGVMIDDLITKDVKEPYRLFSSRAEHRLVLRNDNADIRLMEYGRSFGLIDDKTYDAFMFKKDFFKTEKERLNKIYIHPSPETDAKLKGIGTPALNAESSLLQLLRRPEVPYETLSVFTEIPKLTGHVSEYFVSEIKYEGYIKKQNEQIEKFKKLEEKIIPPEFDFMKAEGLPLEARQRLNEIKPDTLGMASRIQGVTPSDINVLLLLIKKFSN
ncbi:MAG: tRNA uridine-5-carboxymethylaminomethyl(34) synthesis enzyme MnmG [Candidatus Goldbacteria bacterium]|nr:tRNA uridine-5-carboxymethylaminomethyl(34) synthesis enzyme MnmG [Candidatus Goldiibacteriota bacterium]